LSARQGWNAQRRVRAALGNFHLHSSVAPSRTGTSAQTHGAIAAMTRSHSDYVSLYGKRVLIIEEDDLLFLALRDALEDAGCETLRTESYVPDMPPAVPDTHIDVALLDIDPSSTTGESLLRRLQRRGVPLVLISADESALSSQGDEPARQLRKPFTERELLDGVADVLHLQGKWVDDDLDDDT
jgi:CheY-like chemotaxis protein